MIKMKNYSVPTTEQTLLEHMAALCTGSGGAYATGSDMLPGDGEFGNIDIPED